MSKILPNCKTYHKPTQLTGQQLIVFLWVSFSVFVKRKYEVGIKSHTQSSATIMSSVA